MYEDLLTDCRTFNDIRQIYFEPRQRVENIFYLKEALHLTDPYINLEQIYDFIPSFNKPKFDSPIDDHATLFLHDRRRTGTKLYSIKINFITTN